MIELDNHLSGASQALLAAALSGLLCLASASCTGASSAQAHADKDAVTSGSDAASDGGRDAATDPDSEPPANGDTPVPDTACDGGVSPDAGVTSSTTGALTLEQFTALCDAKHGIVEIQPHCGGSNACRGMSYDSNTQTLTEHTCRGTNTCGGYSCVICD